MHVCARAMPGEQSFDEHNKALLLHWVNTDILSASGALKVVAANGILTSFSASSSISDLISKSMGSLVRKLGDRFTCSIRTIGTQLPK